MDNKQKYENALERCKKEFNFNNLAYSHEEIKQRLERVFPELKESEDERIRKEIIQSIQDNMCVIHKDKCIAWLKKQGEQKPADKVEPKFHASDFITDGERIFQIKETVWERNNRNDGSTYCESLIVNLRDGNTYANNTDLKEYHLWTIQDAKDGDVLTTKDAVFIFKHMDVSGLSLCKSHCDVIGNSGLGLGFDFPIQTVHPATEEQRDKLEKAITAAGYKWNAEKKELRKIEQKPNFCHHEVDLSNYSEEYRKAYYDGWNNCNQQHAQLEAEQNHAWSEEDEEMFDAIIADIQFTQKAHTHEVNQAVYEREIDWLKSLKEKYTWKPSDEQIETLLKLEEMHVLEHEKNQENAHLYMVVKSIRELLLKLKGK